MSEFRLHIDIPLGGDEEEAISITEHVMEMIEHELRENKVEGLDQINYRLGHDEARQKSNHLIKTEEGHVAKKKCRIQLTLED